MASGDPLRQAAFNDTNVSVQSSHWRQPGSRSRESASSSVSSQNANSSQRLPDTDRHGQRSMERGSCRRREALIELIVLIAVPLLSALIALGGGGVSALVAGVAGPGAVAGHHPPDLPPGPSRLARRPAVKVVSS